MNNKGIGIQKDNKAIHIGVRRIFFNSKEEYTHL